MTKYPSSSCLGSTVVIGLLFVPLLLPAARAQAPQPQPQPSAAAPNLPAEEPPIGPLRRGPNGEIELVTPESERAEGRALCDPDALCVGEGQTYATLRQALAQAKDGGTIEVIGGTYKEAVTVAVPHLTLRGTAGRPHFDCAGLDLGNGHACIDVAAAGVKLDNLEVSAGDDGACVRQTGGADLDLEEIYCHDSADGVDAGSGTIQIIHSEFYDNAHGNAELGACDTLRVSGSVFRDAHAGAEFVSNCRRTDILDTRFVDRQSGSALDFPTGGNAMVFRSFIEKTETASSDDVAVFTSKSCAHPGTLAFKEVQILNSRHNAVIRNGNRCPEGAVTLEDVTVEGVQVGTQGFINDLGGNALGGGPVR